MASIGSRRVFEELPNPARGESFWPLWNTCAGETCPNLASGKNLRWRCEMLGGVVDR